MAQAGADAENSERGGPHPFPQMKTSIIRILKGRF